MLRSIVVGFAGNQGQEYLPLMMRHSDVVGVVDIAPSSKRLADEFGVNLLGSLDSAISTVDFDVALICLPHRMHFEVCATLSEAGKHVLKEKPLAITEHEATILARTSSIADRSVYTLVQRNFDPAFLFAQRNLNLIGNPYWFDYNYHVNLAHVTSGWRAIGYHAGGGVLLDMGYHLVDVILGTFGAPKTSQATLLHCYEEMRQEQLEDLVNVHLSYDANNFAGALNISRHSYTKLERLTILGTKGSMVIEPLSARVYGPGGVAQHEVSPGISKAGVQERMIVEYLARLDDREYRTNHLDRQLATVQAIQRAYESALTPDGRLLPATR